MITEVKDVRTAGKIVAQVEVPVYETIDELIAEVDSARILAMFNKQNCIRIQGNERAKFQPKRMGKVALLDAAFNNLTAEECNNFAGNAVGLRAFLESDEIQARVSQLGGDDEAVTAPEDE